MHPAPGHGSWLGHISHGNCAFLCRDWGFPGWLSSEESTCQCRTLRDTGSIPGSGRSPGEGNGSPLPYSRLGNSMDKGAWWLQSKGLQRVGHDLVTKQQQQQQHCRDYCWSGNVARFWSIGCNGKSLGFLERLSSWLKKQRKNKTSSSLLPSWLLKFSMISRVPPAILCAWIDLPQENRTQQYWAWWKWEELEILMIPGLLYQLSSYYCLIEHHKCPYVLSHWSLRFLFLALKVLQRVRHDWSDLACSTFF